MYTFPELRTKLKRLPKNLQRLFATDPVAAAVGIGFLMAGVYIRHLNKLGSFKDGLGAMCDALVIAAILKLTVDPVLKRELAKDAAKDVFLYAFGYSLPPKLREFVNDLVLETKIVRRQCHLKWHIAPKSGDPTRVEVYLDASFFIMNFSGSDLPYQHRVFSWKENSEDVGCVKALFCEAKGSNHSTYRKEKPDELTPGLDGFILGDKIHLAAHTEEDQFRIGAVYYAEAEHPGLDQFTIVEPTMEIDVTVTVDDELSDLVFSVVPDPTEKKDSENYVYPERQKSSNKLEYTWSLKRVFVPNERVLIRWKKREIKPPAFVTIP
ncbi:MAG TPA: hypothetical protein VGD64_01220 [Acidisarcina sp.]